MQLLRFKLLKGKYDFWLQKAPASVGRFWGLLKSPKKIILLNEITLQGKIPFFFQNATNGVFTNKANGVFEKSKSKWCVFPPKQQRSLFNQKETQGIFFKTPKNDILQVFFERPGRPADRCLEKETATDRSLMAINSQGN